MSREPELDYADSGLDIQYAKNDQAERFPNKESRPDYLLWGGLKIKTYDVFKVSQRGVVHAEFLSARSDVEQGFDIEIDDGWLELMNGDHVKLLRTWKDERYEDDVQYPFLSKDGLLWVWNVYKMVYGGGQSVEEKWTGNAGFWIDTISEHERIYHCSHGMAQPPDFESLVFKVKVSAEK